MRAILVTPLEQAIIDALRCKSAPYKNIICNTLDLPLPEDVYSFTIESMKDKRVCNIREVISEDIKRIREKQDRNMKCFKLDGYGNKAEFGIGRTRQYLTIDDN